MGDKVIPKWEPGSPDAEPLYSCAGCYENYSWPHTDLRLGTDGLLWCDDCYEEFRPLDDDGEYATPDYADLPQFVPSWKAEIARLTKLRALDEQQFQRLKASFDEVVRQRDEYRLALDEREARIADVRKNLLVGMDKLIEAIESGYDVTEMVEGLKRIVAEARQAGEGEGHEQKA